VSIRRAGRHHQANIVVSDQPGDRRRNIETYIGHLDPASEAKAFPQQKPWLKSSKRDGSRCRKRPTKSATGQRINTGGNVDGKHG